LLFQQPSEEIPAAVLFLSILAEIVHNAARSCVDQIEAISWQGAPAADISISMAE
jgi:hypothetical protein